MAEPIRKPNATAPTPQNTPASVSSMQQPPRATAGAGNMASISENAGLGGLATNPTLLSLIQGRLGTLVGTSSGYIESLPKPVRNRLAGLKALRSEQADIEAEFQRELFELEKKFYQRYLPLYQTRSKIISGSLQPTAEQIASGEQAFEEENEFFGDVGDEEENDDDDEEEDQDKDKASNAKAEAEEPEPESEEDIPAGIPNFWLTTLRNVPPLGELMSDRDDEVLSHLLDVRLKYLETPGYVIEFEFSDNAYFTNKLLSKTYHYRDEIGITGEFVYDYAEGSDIAWSSPEMNVTVRVEKRKQRNKHTKATRTIEKTLPENSFFNFFSPPKLPTSEEDEYDEELQEQLEMDFGLGDIFKEKVIPRAIDWFTGRALDYEDLADPEDGDDLDNQEEYGDDDDEDDEEADGDDDGAAAGKKEVPAECKQQ